MANKLVNIYLLEPPCFNQPDKYVWVGVWEDGRVYTIWKDYSSDTLEKAKDSLISYTSHISDPKVSTYRQEYSDCITGKRGKLAWSIPKSKETVSEGPCRCPKENFTFFGIYCVCGATKAKKQ